jgi:hypothetical protein
MLRASSIYLLLGAFVFESGVFCQTYVPILLVPSLARDVFPTSINQRGDIAGNYFTTGGPLSFVCPADFRPDFVTDCRLFDSFRFGLIPDQGLCCPPLTASMTPER